MPLSAPAALYLAADAVAPKAGRLSYGIDVPGKDFEVDLKTLSGVLAASALWAMHQTSTVVVGWEQKKGLFGTKNRVAIRPGSAAAPAGQLEAGLLQALDDKDPFAKGVVARWLRRDSTNPWGVVTSAVEADLVQAGVLRPVEPTGKLAKLGRLAGARQKMSATPEAIAATRPEVDAWLHRWTGFCQAEPQLSQALVKECRDGLDSRLEQDDD